MSEFLNEEFPLIGELNQMSLALALNAFEEIFSNNESTSAWIHKIVGSKVPSSSISTLLSILSTLFKDF